MSMRFPTMFEVFYHAAGPWPALVALILGVMLRHVATCVFCPKEALPQGPWSGGNWEE